MNIRAPVGLHELTAQTDAGWQTLKDGYESALAAFESGEARKAARILGNVLEHAQDDGPSLRLLARAVEAMSDPAAVRPSGSYRGNSRLRFLR